jgi:hypothetical protein
VEVTLEQAKAAGFPLGSGFLDVITPADPAAGANITVSLGATRYIVVRSVLVTLTTDANVANRFVSVDYGIGSRYTVVRNAATVFVTASTTAQVFQFDNQHHVSEWNTGTMIFAPLLPLPLPSGFPVTVTVDSIQATDQLSSCRIVVERYYDDDATD